MTSIKCASCLFIDINCLQLIAFTQVLTIDFCLTLTPAKACLINMTVVSYGQDIKYFIISRIYCDSEMCGCMLFNDSFIFDHCIRALSQRGCLR